MLELAFFSTSVGSRPRALCVGALLLGGCYSSGDPPPRLDTDSTGGSMGDGSSDDAVAPTTEGSPEESGQDDTGLCSADRAPDPACEDTTPYCLDGTCVGCGELGEDACGAIDPTKPVCDPNGACVECSADDVAACDPTQICSEGTCSPCSADDQCPSGVCLVDAGECLLEEVLVEGVVLRYDTVEPTPQEGVTVRMTNVVDAPSDGPTTADGRYAIEKIPPGTLLDIELEYPQDDPVFVPASLRTRMAMRVDNDTPVQIDPQLVTYGFMAKVAFECGLFGSLEEAIGGSAVNTYFTQRSTVFGRLVDEAGNGVSTISRSALQADLDGVPNFHLSIADPDPQRPSFVCFLDEDPGSGTYVGTTDDFSNDSGRFVMFRVRDASGTGQGLAQVKASGFEPAVVNLKSTGNIGVVELRRNGEAIPRDFAIDVYPIFTTHTCVGCHTAGGPTQAVRAGYNADWDLDPRSVWTNLIGPGTECNDPLNPVRVCTNDPQLSLLVTRPLTDPVGVDDPHPVEIFPSIDDPSMQVILQWIEQGAQPPKDIDFVNDIYPLFTKHGCIGCHTNGGPPEAVTAGYNADWNLSPDLVWQNLTGPGTTCPEGQPPLRVCTDAPQRSMLVTWPLTDPNDSDDAHPVDAFGSINDPDLQLIVQWIGQGAQYETQCIHSECSVGEALTPGCSPCVTSVCSQDSFCCTSSWDETCVNAALQNVACGC